MIYAVNLASACPCALEFSGFSNRTDFAIGTSEPSQNGNGQGGR
jgi:hypothetical protein